MGTWRTSISGNDTYADVYYEFFELYNEGWSVADISAKLCAENQEIYEDPKEGQNFWFALAKAQWDCQALSPDIHQRVKSIINSGQDIRKWQELDVSDTDLVKRQKALDAFLETLATERPKKRLPKKKSTVMHNPPYKKGECRTFKLSDGNYGGFVVLEEIITTLDKGPYNLLAYTNINSNTLPTLHDFKRASVLYGEHEDVDLETEKEIRVTFPGLFWTHGKREKNTETLTTLIGVLDVKKKYSPHSDKPHAMYGGLFNEYDVKGVDLMLTTKQPEDDRLNIGNLIGMGFWTTALNRLSKNYSLRE